MKTTTDIAAFLKRENNSPCLTILYDGKQFEVSCSKSDVARSRYLDDALENLSEAMRRRANQMAPVRESKSEPNPTSGTAFTWTLSGSSMTPKPTAPPRQINGPVPSCPACARLPDSASAGGSISCGCGFKWNANTADVYAFNLFSGKWKWDGTQWLCVAP